MKRTSLIIFFIAINIILHAQNYKKKTYNYTMLQGVWQMEFNYTYPNENSFYKDFHIFKNKKWLTVSTDTEIFDRFNCVVTEFGFSNTSDRYRIKELQDSGTVYISIKENGNVKDSYLNIDANFLVIEKQNLIIFNDECMYLTEAPKEVLKIMYVRGKHDKRDYIKEFLYIDVRGIKAEKTYIYDSTENKTEKILLKNDIVTVIGKQNDFLIIKYEIPKGKITDALRPKSEIIIGLVKKEDVDLPIND